MDEEYDVVNDVLGAMITCSLLNSTIQKLRAQAASVPLEKWLIISHSRQFNAFAHLWDLEQPDIIKEQTEMMVKVPIEIKYAGVRWITDDSLSPDVVRIEAGKSCGLIKRLATVGW